MASDELKINLVVILGPTATGKTRLAALLADRLKSGVISADSRQVYRGMDLGTGKDMDDYRVKGRKVPVALIDIHDPGYRYSVFEYQGDFKKAFDRFRQDNRIPVLAGGSGMYLEAVLNDYRMAPVPENSGLRKQLEHQSMEELTQMLKQYRDLHNITDTEDRERLLRALEIAVYQSEHPEGSVDLREIRPLIFGIRLERQEIRKRITERLKRRLDAGMIDEVRDLVKRGLDYEDLAYYGLEYKYLAYYIRGLYDYGRMFRELNTAIHRFAKKQMTWFGRMERKGTHIRWIDGTLDDEARLEKIRNTVSRFSE